MRDARSVGAPHARRAARLCRRGGSTRREGVHLRRRRGGTSRGRGRGAHHAPRDRRAARGAERRRGRPRRAPFNRADAARRAGRDGRPRRGGRRERRHPRGRDPRDRQRRAGRPPAHAARGHGCEGARGMTIQNRFDTISPLDNRFYGGDATLYKALHPYLSAAAAIRYQARVEGALAQALADVGICDHAAADAIARAADRSTPQEVAEEETKTRHDVRALVNVIRAQVPDEAKRFVHLGATSSDIVDTANALRYRECVDRVLVPTIAALIARCISIAEAEAETTQIGRTHGRHAEPVTFGFALAEYVARLGDRLEQLRLAAPRMPGKLPGAVRPYNALRLLSTDPPALERRFLSSLGLHAAPVSTQIVPPEGWTDLAHACISALGVMANLADDMRQLQRSEIGEVAESFATDQVGSSTMPHKRNPVSFENVKSIWKAIAPRMLTTYMDQISEHQRDLTNSASQRFLGELLAATTYAAGRLASSLDGMRVDRERLKANL